MRRIRQNGVYTLQATEAYDENDPADSPVSWGTDAEVASQNQAMSAETGDKAHLGVLITFTPETPDVFNAVYAKIRPTYAANETPAIEMWTHDAVTLAWTKRRRVSISNLLVGVRSGETKVFRLTLDSGGLENIDRVWVTMAPSTPLGTQANAFLAIWAYGTCEEQVFTPDCPPDVPPEECEENDGGGGGGGTRDLPCSCDQIARTLGVNPEDLCDPNFDITTFLDTLGYTDDELCQGTTESNPCEAFARAVGLDPELVCRDLTCEEVAAALGLSANDICTGPLGPTGPFDCESAARFLGLDPEETCRRDPPFPNIQPPTDPCDTEGVYVDPETFEPAADPTCDAPDAIDAPEWAQVYENWFVYVDNARNTAAVRAQQLTERQIRRLRTYPNELAFYRAMQAAQQYLQFENNDDVFDKCWVGNTRQLEFQFNQLAQGTIITIQAHVFPVDRFIAETVPGWLRDLRRGSFPPQNRSGRRTFPLCGGGGTQPQMKIFRNFLVTPQFEKYAGDAIEPNTFHLEVGAPEVGVLEEFSFIPTRFADAAGNPLTVDDAFPECNPNPSQPGQKWNEGWAILIRLAGYTPIVDGEPLVSTSSFSIHRILSNVPITNANYAALTIDACWP